MADTLDKLIRLFRDSNIAVKIGILENSARFTKNSGDEGAVGDLGNADVGAVHEFGGGSVPQRSFLRMPLETQMNKKIEQSGINEETLKEAQKADTLLPFAEGIAAAAKACVDGAFDSGGYGNWAPHSPNTHSETGQLLVDTKQLRSSISTEIIKKS